MPLSATLIMDAMDSNEVQFFGSESLMKTFHWKRVLSEVSTANLAASLSQRDV